jgi:hypothetical protein
MVKIRCSTNGGGAVSLNSKHHVWASYRVAGVADKPKPELLYAGAQLRDGRSVQLFLNRETNLIVVDVIDRGGRGGVENCAVL